MTTVTPPPAPVSDWQPEPSLGIYLLAKTWNEEFGKIAPTKAEFNSLSNRRVLSNLTNSVVMLGASVYSGIQGTQNYSANGLSGSAAINIGACLLFALLARKAFRVMRADWALRGINQKYGPLTAQDMIERAVSYHKNNKLTRGLKS